MALNCSTTPSRLQQPAAAHRAMTLASPCAGSGRGATATATRRSMQLLHATKAIPVMVSRPLHYRSSSNSSSLCSSRVTGPGRRSLTLHVSRNTAGGTANNATNGRGSSSSSSSGSSDTAGPLMSATEAAAFNELAADAAVQQAAEQHTSDSALPTASVEGAESAALAAGSAGTAHAPGPDSKHKKGSSAPPTQKLQTKLDDMASKYKALDSRLDSLESTLITLLRNVKDKARRPAAAAGVGPAGDTQEGAAAAVLADANGDMPQFDGYDPDGFDDEGGDHGGLFDLKKLQTSLSENINRGYLESVKHLRDMLMAYEWHMHGKELAERKGVSQFEKHCADNDLEIDFDVLSQLYQNPNDLSVLNNNKLKLLARSIIQQAVDERYCSIYFECTNTAKELAHTGLKDMIPDSAGKVGGVIKDMLPLPGFLKK